MTNAKDKDGNLLPDVDRLTKYGEFLRNTSLDELPELINILKGDSLLVTSVLSQIINSWPNKKLMNYSYLEQLKDILPGIVLAAFMGVCVYCVNFLHLSNWLTLIIQVPLGAVIYIGLSALLKLESFTYVWNMVKPMLQKIFGKKKGKL